MITAHYSTPLAPISAQPQTPPPAGQSQTPHVMLPERFARAFTDDNRQAERGHHVFEEVKKKCVYSPGMASKCSASSHETKEIVTKLREMRLSRAADLVESKYGLPCNHWRQLRTNNRLERIIREMRRRTRVVGPFPDGHSALMLVAAKLRHIASTRWGK